MYVCGLASCPALLQQVRAIQFSVRAQPLLPARAANAFLLAPHDGSPSSQVSKTNAVDNKTRRVEESFHALPIVPSTELAPEYFLFSCKGLVGDRA